MNYDKVKLHIKTLREWVFASKRLDKAASRNSTLRKRTGGRGGLTTTLNARHDLAAKEVWDFESRAASESSALFMRPVNGDRIAVPIQLFVDLVHHLDGCSHGYPDGLFADGDRIIREELELIDGLYFLKDRAKTHHTTTGSTAAPVFTGSAQTAGVDK